MAEAGTEPRAQRADKGLIPQNTVWLMAITVGVIVANIYYIQPLLADIGQTFGLSVTQVGIVAMLSQAGTALGMFLFVPLGDKCERRSLILLLVLGASVSLLLMGIAPNAFWLGCAAFAIGAFNANVQHDAFDELACCDNPTSIKAIGNMPHEKCQGDHRKELK